VRRRLLVGLVAGAVVLGLLAVGVVVAEGVARDRVEAEVRAQVRSALGLEASAPVEVRTSEAPMLLQLLSGRLDRVEVRADEVTFGGFAGPLSGAATGVPIAAGGAVDTLRVRFRVPEEQLAAASSELTDLPIDDLSIDGDEIAVRSEVEVLFATVPLGVRLAPTAVDGGIRLEPTSIRLGELELGVGDLRDRLGPLVADALRPQEVCIADQLPASIRLSDVTLDGDRLVLDLSGDGAVLDEEALAELGTC